MTVVPIAQYLVQFGKDVAIEAEAGREILPLQQSFDPRAEEELALKLEAANAAAREEGQAAAAAEFDLALAEERARFEEHLAGAREAWLAEEGQRLGAAAETALAELERRLADSVARILEPFLETLLREQVVAELARTLSALTAEGEPLLRVSGPASLVEALKEKLGASRGAVEYLPAQSGDISVTVDQTVVETRLEAWIDRFRQALEVRDG